MTGGQTLQFEPELCTAVLLRNGRVYYCMNPLYHHQNPTMRAHWSPDGLMWTPRRSWPVAPASGRKIA